MEGKPAIGHLLLFSGGGYLTYRQASFGTLSK